MAQLGLSVTGSLLVRAPLGATLILGVEVAMGATLLVGAYLARRHRYRAHKYCQMSVVILNLVPIALVMIPSFHLNVQSGLPTNVGTEYDAVAVAHGVAGAAAELAALYVIAVAGSALVPERFRFARYALWMRVTLVLWFVALGLGVLTYYVWYVAPIASG